MSTRELILLSPYRVPTQNTLYLGEEEVAAFLNGYTALWHPAALLGASAPPRVASPYDHEQPSPGHLYAVPENPPLMLADDWEERVRQNGAALFRCSADRGETLAGLLEALRGWSEAAATPEVLLGLTDEQVRPFLGVGFGYLHVEALFEAMSHENVLAVAQFWEHMTAAVRSLIDSQVGDPRAHLQEAADVLMGGREVLYPVTIHLIDLCLWNERSFEMGWPEAFDRRLPFNLVTWAALLERLGREQPERLAALRERVSSDLAEVCCGGYQEREEPFLPVESQMWSLSKAQQVVRSLFGRDLRVFARQRFGFHPQLPLFLQNAGIGKALLVSFDGSVLPAHRSPLISWSSADGKQIEALTRTPEAADSAQTFFHLTYHLRQTIMQDQTATFVLVHRDHPACPWYGDWLELSRLAPVLGRWTTLSGYFGEVLAGDYAAPASADEFHAEYLVERSLQEDSPFTANEGGLAGEAPQRPTPISFFAGHLRQRRLLDTAWALAALQQSLGGSLPEVGGVSFLEHLTRLEDELESGAISTAKALPEAQHLAAEALAQRLVARGTAGNPGFLVLNPCSFKRRVALELEDVQTPLAVAGPLKACQPEGGTARVVVEVPALGFAWIPKRPQTAGATHRPLKMADDRCVRNEFFEAEVDFQTGGLRSLRDQRTRVGRLGQQLVFNPGSVMRVKEIRTTATGPALGEIVSEGTLLDHQEQVIATFRQRFRAWLGRPILELRIEIFPTHQPAGYPWHAYYAARLAWRDERAVLLRGVNGQTSLTSHTRPETPDFLEIREGRHSTTVLPGGLPFHQRHGSRMLDVLLICPGETAHTFDLGIAIDRDYPMQTALGMTTPTPVIAVEQGPPHVGAEGWLFHLDAPNLALTSLRPLLDGKKGVLARLLEVTGIGVQAELRCVRDPQRATLVDALGNPQGDLPLQGDAVILDVASNGLLQVRIEL